MFVTTTAGAFRYDVREKMVVDPDEASVLDPTPDNRLTLTTCHPRYSAAQRLIVVAELIGGTVESPSAPPADTPRPGHSGPDSEPSAAMADTDAGLSGLRASKEPVIAWGALAAVVWFGAWFLSRHWRRWPAYALATPVFLVVLFMFYELVARLLPANV